jgi:tetratricopeptide (TPR) repeat protein
MVGLLAAAIWGVGRLVNRGPAGGDSASLVDHWESPAERLANVSRAMNQQEVGCTASELRDIARLLAKVTSASRDGDDEAFRACFDLNLLVRRIGRHPSVSGNGLFQAWSLKNELSSSLEVPTGHGEMSIVRFERGPRRDEALVYTVEAGHVATAAYRWWLVRAGRNWKLFDYERTDDGQSLAQRWAIHDQIQRDPYGYTYNRLQDAIAEPAGRAARFRGSVWTSPEGELEGLLNAPLPAIVHDFGKIDLAWALVGQNRASEALAACDLVQRPEEHPGVHIVRGHALALLGRHTKALAEAQTYQQLAGRDPQALEIEAEALEELERLPEAAAKWRELLKLYPEYAQALTSFCQLADDSQKTELPQLLAKTRRPLDTASQQAVWALYRDDSATFDAIVKFVRQRAADSPVLDALAGRRLEQEEQFDQAAACFLQASKREWLPEKKQEHFDSFLAAMNSAGRAVEAYAQADDSQAAFELLTSGYEERESLISEEQIGPLLIAHRKKRPADPMVDYYAGLMLLRQERYAEAEEKFVSASGKARDDDEKELIRNRRIEALYRQGRLEAVYQDYGRSSDVFQQLARLCQSDGRWEELRRLINTHRQTAASDPWLNYFSALDLHHRGQHQPALDELQRAERGDETLQSYCQWVKSEYQVAAGRLAEAYASGDDRRQSFAALAARLARDEQWERLMELVRLHEAGFPLDPEARHWKVTALWNQGQYGAIADELSPWPDFAHRGQGDTIEGLHDMLVRSLLRLNRLPEAHAAAERASREQDYQVPLVMVLLADGTAAALRERLADPLLVRALAERPLHEDRELGKLFSRSDLADLRTRFVLPLPNGSESDGGRIVLLLAQHVELSREQLADRLAKLSVPAEAIHSVPRLSGDVCASYFVQHAAAALVVTFGQAPFCHCGPEQPLPRNQRLADVICDHGGYVVVHFGGGGDQPGRPGGEILAGRLAAELCSEGALAVHGSRQKADSQRLELIDAAAVAQLSSGDFLRQPAADYESFYLIDSPALDRPMGSDAAGQSWSKRRPLLHQLVERVRGGQAGDAEILVILWRGHARERLWLKVVGAKSARYGNWRLHAELPTGSVLWPHLQAGMRIEVDFHNVLAARG